MVNPRQDLANALSEAGVEFPPSATVQQLRNLLRSVVGTGEGAASSAPEDVADSDSDGAFNNGTDALNSTILFDCTAAAAYNQTTTTTDADSDTAVHAAIGTTAATTNTAGEMNKDQRAMPTLRDLDEDVIALKKRIEILTLRKRVEELECRVPKENRRRLDFGDIEHALPKFNGDDVSYSVLHFLRDFEEIMNTSGADDSFKLLALRRSLKGTARVFLSTTTALNYDSLKTALTAEFGKAITRQEIYRMLAQRKWKKKDESIHCYILHMQALAKRANIDETELIDFIIDGMGNSVSNIQLLMMARTIDELKTLVNRYQQKFTPANVTGVGSKQPNTTNAKQPSTTTNIERRTAKPKADSTLCFNCSRYGHMKPNCPYPLRPDGSCFHCWLVGHDHRSCPNPAKVLKPRDDVAFIENEADYEGGAV